MNHLTKGDNMIRSVNIQITNSKTNRPIVRLYPLEVTSFDMVVVTAPATDTDTQNSTTSSASRPTREAAKRSRQKTREWVDLL